MRVYCVLVFGILFAVDLTSTTDSTFINIFTCVQACKGWIIDTFPTVCDKCVANPPVSRKLCDFSRSAEIQTSPKSQIKLPHRSEG